MSLPFEEKTIWKGLEVSWCDQCGTYVITCPKCGGSTCNCHACPECTVIFDDFSEAKTRPQNYLTEAEKLVYEKAGRLKRLILTSLGMGHKAIDWQAMETAGELCERDRTLFPAETKDLVPYRQKP